MNGSMPMVLKFRDQIPLGLLLTPLGGLGVETAFATDLAIAVDNGAFAGFNPTRFRRLLARIPDPGRCLWVSAPDVVGNAEATLALFDAWQPEIRNRGFRVAMVGQDGFEAVSLARRESYWDRCDAFFVGGTDAFKLPPDLRGGGHCEMGSFVPAIPLIREARERGKWVHFGRVNTLTRFRYCERLEVDSVDGSGMVRFTKAEFPRIRRHFERTGSCPLFGE